MATMMFRVSPISILKTPRLRYACGGWPEAVVESRVNVALRMPRIMSKNYLILTSIVWMV